MSTPNLGSTEYYHYNMDDYVLARDLEPVPKKLSYAVAQRFVPQGMMGLKETVKTISVGSLPKGPYFEVNISDVLSPTCFWITLRDNESKISNLMDEIHCFYKQQDLDACRVPQAVVNVGLNVACIFDEMWHRAIVTQLKLDGGVEVSFYDYGTVKTYRQNEVYYLHKRFSDLPAQALACGLYNVKAPTGNEWSPRSIDMFIDRVWNVPMVATVCETNENNNSMTITLTDTNDDAVDVHLDEWLIERQLAVRGKLENNNTVKSD